MSEESSIEGADDKPTYVTVEDWIELDNDAS